MKNIECDKMRTDRSKIYMEVMIIMNKTAITLIVVGVIIVLFAVFCPLIIAEMHAMMWRIIIGLLGCFSFVTGIYKTACRK